MITNDPVLVTFEFLGGDEILITAWTLLGFLGNNVLFTARVIIQWVASERVGRSVAPKAFWWLSLAAALIMICYTLQRSTDPKFSENVSPIPFLIGFLITLVPYVRNLMLSYNVARRWHIVSYIFSGIIFIVCLGLLVKMKTPIIRSRWFYLGMAGSLIWYTRFLWQWLYSERKKQSEFPLSFWYITLTGLTLNTVYSVMMRDIVFILGFIFNVIPISRNIILTRRHHKAMNPHS